MAKGKSSTKKSSKKVQNNTLLDSGFTSGGTTRSTKNAKKQRSTSSSHTNATSTNATKQQSTSSSNTNATKPIVEKFTCDLSDDMSNSDKAASVEELLTRVFIKPSFEVEVVVTDCRIEIRIICPDPECTSALRYQQKANKMLVESGVISHFKGGYFSCIVSTIKRKNRIETLCKDVEERTNNANATETQEPTASESEAFVNSPTTSSQNTNNVDATDVDATNVDATDVDATNVDATDVDATNVDADEPNDTFNPEDIAMGDSGSPRTFDSPVLLSEQVGEVTNTSMVDNGGDDGQKLSQLTDIVSNFEQQLRAIQAENGRLKQRLTAVELSNSRLQQRCSIMEQQLHLLVSENGAPIVTPRSKHIIKPQLIRFGTGRTLSTARIDAADRRRMSGNKRKHS